MCVRITYIRTSIIEKDTHPDTPKKIVKEEWMWEKWDEHSKTKHFSQDHDERV